MAPIDAFSLKDFDRTFAVNVRAVFVATQAAVKYMKEGGRVITIGVLIVGIGFVAVLTGAVAQRFLAWQIEAVSDTAQEIEALYGLPRFTEAVSDIKNVKRDCILKL
jgi:hypothetical protein